MSGRESGDPPNPAIMRPRTLHPLHDKIAIYSSGWFPSFHGGQGLSWKKPQAAGYNPTSRVGLFLAAAPCWPRYTLQPKSFVSSCGTHNNANRDAGWRIFYAEKH